VGKQIPIKPLVEISIFAGLALILSFVTVFKLPQGGSISLETLPIIMISIRRGILAGILTGVIFAVMAMLFAGSIYNPIQALLDYPFAFGLIGLTGVFAQQIKNHHRPYLFLTLSVAVALIVRLFFHTLSGIIYFASYTPKSQNVFVYSLVYNAGYLIPSSLIVLTILLFLETTNPKLFLP
jgi:thiamine transporter